MNRRRSLISLCMLSALLVSAFAVQSASAISGTTAFTCVKGGGSKTLRGEHCLTTGTTAQEYGHVAVAENTTTELSVTNKATANETITRSTGRLKVTIAGVPLELTTTDVEGTGELENKKAASGEHYTHSKGTLTFTEVLVAKPEGRGCKVYTDAEGAKTEGEAGVVHTRELTATTEGQSDFVKFEPADGSAKSFASFFVTCEEGKKIPQIEGTWECSGSIKGVPNGATINFTHTETTTQNTLRCRGSKSGIEGSTTLSGREKGSSGSYMPLAQTTVATETPTIPGPTLFTCVKGGGNEELRGEHCITTGAAAQEYGHVEVQQDVTTELSGTNANTDAETAEAASAKMKMTVSGVPVELSAAAVSAAGWMTNARGANGAHYAHGKLVLTFAGLEVTQPAGKGCKVTTDNEVNGTEGEVGVIHTRELAATTEGQEDLIKVQAADAGDVARFFLTCEEGKKVPAIEGTWSCGGSVKGVPAGATTVFTHEETTTLNTLKCKDAKAGIEGNLTVSGRSSFEELYEPLAATTVTT